MTNDLPLLTVAIPTYNRPEHLVRCLEALRGNLRPEVAVLVLDNCSEKPVSAVISGLADPEFESRVQVIRNRFNVGASSNVMRCIEHCHSTYIWILADDDIPLPGCVERILTDLREHAPLTINYYAESTDHPVRTTLRRAKGAAEFLSFFSRLGEVICLSTNVYHVPSAQQHLRAGLHGAYTNIPHLIVSLKALGSEGVGLQSPAMLVDRPPPPSEHQASLLPIALGLGLVLELFDEEPILRELRRLLRPDLRRWPSTGGVYRELIERSVLLANPSVQRHRARQLGSRWMRECGGRVAALRWRMLCVVLHFPGLAVRLLGLALRRRGKSLRSSGHIRAQEGRI